MDIRKLITSLALCLCVFAMHSCDEKDKSVTVSKEKYDALQEKYDMLKESTESTLSASEQTHAELNMLMQELNQVSGQTLSLQMDVERGRMADKRTTTERIKESIANIKKRLNNIPTQKADKRTLALVKSLRNTIELNEKEIDRLNNVIEEKNTTINTLDQKLTDTNKELEVTLNKLQQNEKESWINMGDALVSTANLLPHVKGHGNMKPIKKAKIEILNRAKACYKRAMDLGAANAKSKISDVELYLYSED